MLEIEGPLAPKILNYINKHSNMTSPPHKLAITQLPVTEYILKLRRRF